MPIVVSHTRSSTGRERIVVEGLSEGRRVAVTPHAKGGMIIGRRGRSIDADQARREIASALGVKTVSWDALVAAAGRLGARSPAPNGGVLPSCAPYARSDGERLRPASLTLGLEGVLILVDHTEPKSVVAALGEIPGLVVQRARLPVGDYVIPGILTVERKAASDFDHSITLRDGRMFSQMERMTAMPGVRAVVIEEAYSSRRWPLEGLTALTAEIASLGGTSVIPSLSPRHTALVIASLARFAVGAPAPARQARVPLPVDPRAAALDVLASFPGVSRAIARSLLDRFGSPRAVALASEAELVAVPGMGPARARALARAFDVEASEGAIPDATPVVHLTKPDPEIGPSGRPRVRRPSRTPPSFVLPSHGMTGDLFASPS